MKPDLLEAFGIKEATDELCVTAGLPPIEWDNLTEETVVEMCNTTYGTCE